MASSIPKQRVKDESTTKTTSTPTAADGSTVEAADWGDNGKGRRDRRIAMAKRGLRSLCIAVAIPLSVTLLNIYFFGTSDGYRSMSSKPPIWLPPLWALHATGLGSAFLMGLSSWLVWAEGGLHRDPSLMILYIAQLGLGLVWDPLVFRMGAYWAGLLVALSAFGSLLRCRRMFRRVNTIAGDLVMPCLAWAGFLAFLNLKLILASHSQQE
ncbi:hypothetical protein Ancab_013719 [Ancistrocladus abbreviatus]